MSWWTSPTHGFVASTALCSGGITGGSGGRGMQLLLLLLSSLHVWLLLLSDLYLALLLLMRLATTH